MVKIRAEYTITGVTAFVSLCFPVIKTRNNDGLRSTPSQRSAYGTQEHAAVPCIVKDTRKKNGARKERKLIVVEYYRMRISCSVDRPSLKQMTGVQISEEGHKKMICRISRAFGFQVLKPVCLLCPSASLYLSRSPSGSDRSTIPLEPPCVSAAAEHEAGLGGKHKHVLIR